MAIRGGRSGGPGGGGRSHFGGSSSSGRSHSSSSSSSHHRMSSSHHRIGGIHHHHGGGVMIHFHGRLGAGSVFFILAAVALFFTLIVGLALVGQNTALKTIEQDYFNYQTMIENTMHNPAYRREALVTEKYEGAGGKWYIRYEYELDTMNETAYDESFAHYTKEQLSSYIVGQTKIIIVTEESVVSEYTTTIPLDYYESGVENDGEYIEIKEFKNTLTIVVIVLGALGILLIVLGVKKCIKASKKEESGNNTTSTQQTHTTCPYCGARVSLDKNVCPRCGAGLN